MERAELANRLGGKAAGGATEKRQLIVARCPAEFMRDFARAAAGEGEVFLGDPAWGPSELAQVEELMALPAEGPGGGKTGGWLCIPTGGSSGRIRFARHDGATIAASVEGFVRHFGVKKANAVGVLPMHHVSGFMAWMRCVLTGGEFRPLDWKEVEAGRFPELPPVEDSWFVSLVPTQLERLTAGADAAEWLRGFRAVFVGGGPAWRDLLDRAAAARLPVVLSYGMTETAAMVVAQRAGEFAGGDRSSGRSMPHCSVGIGADGEIAVDGPSVFRGYFPEWRQGTRFATADAGEIDGEGRLRVLGRRDAVIITGGEKVNPIEVEEALRETGEFDDAVVFGMPDASWGEAVAAAFPEGRRPDSQRVERGLKGRLSPAKRPKFYVAIRDWPVTAAGKVNRAEVARRASATIRAGSAIPGANNPTP